VPGYLRCYPFALATASTDRYAMVFDRTADMVGEQPDVPFFEGNALSQPVQERLELCRTYQTERQRTEAFCSTLKRHDLLVQQQANHTVDGQEETIARYFAVEWDRVMSLEKDTIAELLHNGAVAAILAHLFSLDNFAELVQLRQRRSRT
jgi:hypothetical protein